MSRDEVGTHPFEEPEHDNPHLRALVEREPPLQVYCDYEAITDAEGNQAPILLCAETNEDDERNLSTVLTARPPSLTGWKT